MSTRWYTAAYRTVSGAIVPVGIDSPAKAHAENEVADWQEEAPDRGCFLAFRDVPDWRPLVES